MEAARILGMRVDPIGYEQVLKKVFAWAEAGESRYVCVANAGVEAYTGMDVLEGSSSGGGVYTAPVYPRDHAGRPRSFDAIPERGEAA